MNYFGENLFKISESLMKEKVNAQSMWKNVKYFVVMAWVHAYIIILVLNSFTFVIHTLVELPGMTTVSVIQDTLIWF